MLFRQSNCETATYEPLSVLNEFTIGVQKKLPSLRGEEKKRRNEKKVLF